MNLWERAKAIPHGLKVLSEWIGDGGDVVPQDVAQDRASICIKCPKNEARWMPSDTVAAAIKKHLEVKNKLELRVVGEKNLGTCSVCTCVIRLLIWEPQDRVKAQLQPDEIYPNFCWKTK